MDRSESGSEAEGQQEYGWHLEEEALDIGGGSRISLANFQTCKVEEGKDYVLTSPRSLRACHRHRVCPVDLLPRAYYEFDQIYGVAGASKDEVQQEFQKYEIRRRELLSLVRRERDQLIAETEPKHTGSTMRNKPAKGGSEWTLHAGMDVGIRQSDRWHSTNGNNMIGKKKGKQNNAGNDPEYREVLSFVKAPPGSGFRMEAPPPLPTPYTPPATSTMKKKKAKKAGYNRHHDLTTSMLSTSPQTDRRHRCRTQSNSPSYSSGTDSGVDTSMHNKNSSYSIWHDSIHPPEDESRGTRAARDEQYEERLCEMESVLKRIEQTLVDEEDALPATLHRRRFEVQQNVIRNEQRRDAASDASERKHAELQHQLAQQSTKHKRVYAAAQLQRATIASENAAAERNRGTAARAKVHSAEVREEMKRGESARRKASALKRAEEAKAKDMHSLQRALKAKLAADMARHSARQQAVTEEEQMGQTLRRLQVAQKDRRIALLAQRRSALHAISRQSSITASATREAFAGARQGAYIMVRHEREMSHRVKLEHMRSNLHSPPLHTPHSSFLC